MTQQELYDESVRRCKAFLRLNKLSLPRFITYDEAKDAYDRRLTATTRGGATAGMATGFYTNHPRLGSTVYVNLAKCALPVVNPGHRRWSFPFWKTDRTPMGVVAHETGHHVFASFGNAHRNPAWVAAVRGKQVSGYEPTAEEAAAETLRLFILNPTLLQEALPARYAFLTAQLGLRPSESRHWSHVALLGAHPDYAAAAQRWTA